MAWTTTDLRGQRAGGANIREDLSNMISNIDRDETPFLSSIGTNKATGPLHEWLTDTYDMPRDNQQSEGFTFSDSSSDLNQSARERLDNRTQVFGKHILASGSAISSDVAGVANEFAYQLKKKGVEIRRDIDRQATRFIESGAATAGAPVTKTAATASAGGRMASVFAYAAHAYNNDGTAALVLRTATANAGTTGVTGGAAGTSAFYNPAGSVGNNVAFGSAFLSYGNSAPTRAAFSRDALEGLLTSMFNEGGKPSVAQIPSGIKTSVSAALIDGGNSGEASRRATAMEKKLNLAVMGVMTDFGFDIALVPNYIMHSYSGAANTVLVYDPKMIKRSVLTPLATEEDRVARYGRAAIMYCEETLEVMNPNSVGTILGVE